MCSKLTIETSERSVVLLLFLNISDTLIKCFFVEFEQINTGQNATRETQTLEKSYIIELFIYPFQSQI